MSNINQQIFQRYARPEFISSTKNDLNSPFSFKEWASSHQGIIPSQEFKQYNEYLVDWYRTKSKTVTDDKLQLKLNYLALLKQLQLFFSAEESENWYNSIDVNNEKEVLLAIPYFAKKLKDISLYYLQLREKIKESRLRYNQTGTNIGIVQQIQKIILSEYTQKSNSSITLPSSLWNSSPQLSSIKSNLAIQLEELYDFHNYFDQSLSLPVSTYFNVNDKEMIDFLSTKNLFLTSTDWVYRMGAIPLSGVFENELSDELVKALAEKYLGEDKYFSSDVPTQSAATDFFDIDILAGNNSFFWPGTVYETKALSLPRYTPIPISDLKLESLATAGTGIDVADTIFVKSQRGIEAAWLRNNLTEFKQDTMNAVINPSSKTSFRYPFPGFGLSGEDLEWTGFSLNSDRRYNFLPTEIKQAIENSYWSTVIELSSSKPLGLNDSTLIENKAYAHKNFNHADRIKLWDFTPEYNQVSINNIVNEYWLYRFDKTDIPIKASGDSVIFWPYEQVDPEQPFPNYYPSNLNDVCSPSPVSSINFGYSVGSNSISSSDVIYKITNYKDTKENAIECCWLSASNVGIAEQNLIKPQSLSLQLHIKPDIYNRFVWEGNDFTDANTVFKPFQHQPDCAFVNTQYATYLDFGKCTCAQVKFTPFGHPGGSYSENKSLADFIIEDNFTPNSLDLNDWRDLYDTSYTSSSSFGWFKTNSEIGWGDGNWVCGDENSGNKFFLRKGKKYVYYRSNIKDLDKEDVNLPDYILRYSYNNTTNNSVWIKAKKDDQGNWIDTGDISPMIINAGDLLLYSRTPSTYYSLTGTQIEEVDISENLGSIWSNYDYLSIDKNKIVVLSYPTINTVTNSTDPQYPKVPYSSIIEIRNWQITGPDSTKHNFKNQSSVVFSPELTGLYTAQITAISGDPTSISRFGAYTLSGIYIFSEIPAITAIPATTTINTLTSYEIQVPGFVVNTPLKGWDYNTSTFNLFTKKENQGGKPFWAKTYVDKNSFTGFKGADVVGNVLRIVNDHNIISQPEFSDTNLLLGNKVEYNRKYPVKMDWVQPIDLEVLVDENKWCTLEFNTTATSNLSSYLFNGNLELIVTPTTKESDLSITNIIDNEPVEVIYNALNSFTWKISAVPEISQTIYNQVSASKSYEALVPWANLGNLNFPTIATIPTNENLYSANEIGGYFTPNHLGASVYVNQNYTTQFNVSSEALSGYFEDITKRYKGRGLSKDYPSTPYDLVSENNVWIKESVEGSSSSGTVKKNIFKKYQKFLPYQSAYESNPRIKVGLITPTSKQSPWGGKEDAEWADSNNYPVSFTGELNISKWTDTQVLKQAGLQVDNWVTDVFGNQYGLYKQIKNLPHIKRKDVYGEIWTRKNSQFVSSAKVSLEGVFDTYSNTSLMGQLTGSGVLKIDMFFDTLFVQTSGALIFEKINYDYDNDRIFSLTDEARYISLAMPVSANLDREFNNQNLSNFEFAKAGDTWFFPNKKLVTVSVCSVKDKKIQTELYQLNLNNTNLEKIFPTIDSDINLINSLSSENIISVDRPVLSYNTFKDEYLYSILCKNEKNKDLIVELTIKNNFRPYIKNATVYQPDSEQINYNPPVITENLQIFLTTNDVLNFQSRAENGPVTYQILEGPSWIKLSSTGLFTGTPPSVGVYEVFFVVSNSFGPTHYRLVVNVTPYNPVFYLYTAGYSTIDGEDGYILHEPETPTTESKIIV